MYARTFILYVKNDTPLVYSLWYFPSSEVTYILSVTNNDGENKTNSKTIKSPVAGTIYEISYGYATKGLIVNAKYGLWNE